MSGKSIEEEIKKVSADIDGIVIAITNVEKEIDDVKAQISTVGQRLDNEELSSEEEKSFLREKDKFLSEEKNKLREKENLLREKENKLIDIREKLREKIEAGRPPMHPNRDIDQVALQQKLDSILQAVNKSDRATPNYSPAYIGNSEKLTLERVGNFLDFQEMVGEDKILSETELFELGSMENEHQVVAFVTPYIQEIVREADGCAVFNSEEYKWIEVSPDPSSHTYN